MKLKSNYHTHSTWCDGKATPEEMASAAESRGFDVLGFSSHLAFPVDDGCALLAEDGSAYVADVRAVAARHAGRLRVLCGGEADYIPGATDPDRARYASLGLDYLIGSIHYVVAPDGAWVCVDDTPARLATGIAAHFGGDAVAFVRAYFRQQREMVARFDFDVVGHLDLVRKFNAKVPYFDEAAPWYLDELAWTAEAVAASGKLAEVNTGAIARGWLDDAYPSPVFRRLLRERGVRFVLSSDAHAPDAIDVAFDRFVPCEDFAEWPFPGDGPAVSRCLEKDLR